MTPWTVALQAPLFVGFPRQEYWSGLPCLPPEDLPDPRSESAAPSPMSPELQADCLCAEPCGDSELGGVYGKPKCHRMSGGGMTP